MKELTRYREVSIQWDVSKYGAHQDLFSYCYKAGMKILKTEFVRK